MSNHIDRIVEKLPEGLTESGIEEVANLLDEVVEERVEEQIKLLEAKVKAFLRTKLEELKESAKRQLENDDEFARRNKVFEAIKTIIAAEIDGEDVNRAVIAYEEHAEKLQLAWSWGMADGSQQTTPLIYDGVMYLANPGAIVQALDAATGDLIWEYRRGQQSEHRSVGGPGPGRMHRNIAIYQDKIYLNTSDAQIVAIDAR